MSDKYNFHIGVGCWIFNPAGQILLGRRLSKHGYDTWAPPGGKIEPDEEPWNCAERELREETGIIISAKNFHLIGVTYDAYPGKPYVTLHYRADAVTMPAKLMEPDKCAVWQWFNLNSLPKPLFLSAQNLLLSHPQL